MCFSLIDKLIPLNYEIVSDFPEEVTVRWQDIARELGLSEQTIQKIHKIHQGDPELCCEEAIKECLIGREVKLNWQSLIEALKNLHMDDLVDIIYENWGKGLVTKFYSRLFTLLILTGHHVGVQKMLQDEKLTFCGIDEDFEQQLAVVVEPHWKHLAPYINPSAPLGSGNKEPVIEQLKKWRERMHPTFGDLSEILSRLYIQPPPPSSVILSNSKDSGTSLPSKDKDGVCSYILVCVATISALLHVFL